MAIEYGWTGFEDGLLDPFVVGSGGRGAAIGAGRYRARTGQNFFNYNPTTNVANTWVAYQRQSLTLGVGTPSATGIARCFFRLISAPNNSGGALLCVGTLSSSGQQGWLALNTDLTWKVWSFNQHSGNSSAALNLEEWYRADLTHVITQVGINVTTATSCSVYTEAGALIQTIAVGNTGTPVATVDLPEDSACGNGSGQGCFLEVHFDDFWWGQADGADQASLAFPTAYRITRVFASAQGSVAQWTGDFRTQIDAPIQSGTATDIQTNASAGQQTFFTKASAASYGISGIEGVIVAAQLRSTGSAGNESLMLGGTYYTVPVTTGLLPLAPRRVGVNYSAISEATFDGWEFGARNDRGTTLQLGTCYLDVLHNGSSVPAPYTDVSGPFRVNILSYTGNGTYQTITGMGFGAQFLWICNGTSTALAVGNTKLARAGGTRGLSNAASSQDTRNGVLSITDDGFTLGPNNNVNQNGIVYCAIGMQDGGGAGFHLSTYGGRVGNALDGVDIIFPAAEQFTPDIAWNIGGSGGTIIKTSTMPAGDFALGWSGTPSGVTTNLIQALQATGYQIGSATFVNQTAGYYWGLILRITGANADFVHVGTATPSGSTHTVTGLPFTPVWVAVQRETGTQQGHWRSSLTHAAAQSTQWNGGNLQSNGITAITADGFSIGSTLSVAGVPIHWIALGPGSAPLGGCLVNLGNGVDSGGIAGCTISLAN